MKQFPRSNSQYGAPMGRSEYGQIWDLPFQSLRLFMVTLDSGGYDDGGAYWGTGAPLYCLCDTCAGGVAIFRRFVRAKSRKAAADAIGDGINDFLIKPIKE